jgi:hypothetical protein
MGFDIDKTKLYLSTKLKSVSKFFSKMLSGNPEVSSKRVIGFISFLTVLVISYKILFSKSNHANETLLKEVLYTLFMIIAATVLGGTVENVMRRPSDVIAQQQQQQQAQACENQEVDKNDLA